MGERTQGLGTRRVDDLRLPWSIIRFGGFVRLDVTKQFFPQEHQKRSYAYILPILDHFVIKKTTQRNNKIEKTHLKYVFQRIRHLTSTIYYILIPLAHHEV